MQNSFIYSYLPSTSRIVEFRDLDLVHMILSPCPPGVILLAGNIQKAAMRNTSNIIVV